MYIVQIILCANFAIETVGGVVKISHDIDCNVLMQWYMYSSMISYTYHVLNHYENKI